MANQTQSSHDPSNVSENDRERKNIRLGIVLSYLRLAISIVVGLLYPPYLLQKVGLANNGLYFFATSLITYTLLISLGMENSYVRFATINEKEKGEEGLKQINGFYLICFAIMAGLMLLVGLVLSLLYGYGIIPYEGSTLESQKTLLFLLLICSVSSSVDFFLSLFTWYVYFRSHFIFEQCLYLAVHIFTVLGCFLALYFGCDIVVVTFISAAVLVLFDLVGLFYALFKLKMGFKKPDSFGPLFKQIFSFTLYIFLMVIVSSINANIGKTLLGQMVGMGAVTLFGYGLQFYMYESQISIAISSQFSPRINSLVVYNQSQETSSLFSKVSFLQLLVLFLIVGGFASCGMDFIYAWLGNAGLSDGDLQGIFILSLSFLLLGLIPLSQQLALEIQRAENKHKYLAIVNIICAIASIGISALAVYLLPVDYKIFGPFIGMAISVVVGMVIFSTVYYQKELSLPMKHYFINFLKIGFIATLSWAIVFVVFRYAVILPVEWNRWWDTLIKGASFLVIYGVLEYFGNRKQLKGVLSKKR
jgi:O-antigen/teichoic acid export membrane protein